MSQEYGYVLEFSDGNMLAVTSNSEVLGVRPDMSTVWHTYGAGEHTYAQIRILEYIIREDDKTKPVPTRDLSRIITGKNPPKGLWAMIEEGAPPEPAFDVEVQDVTRMPISKIRQMMTPEIKSVVHMMSRYVN